MTTPPRAQLPPLPRGIRLLTNTEAVALNERVPMNFTPERCVTCLGQKWFRWLDANGQVVEYDCNCTDQYLLHRYLSHSGVMLNYQRLGWNDFQHLSEDTAAAAFDYIEHQQAYINAGFGLVLHGTKGNGKTLLANLLVKRLIGDGVRCFSTTFTDMIEAFAGGWRDPAKEKWFNQTIRNATVLFIDDVGREYKADRFDTAKMSDDQRRKAASSDTRTGSVRETLLESAIRHRTGMCLPTFITTNHTPDDMLQGYGGHTMSLLAEKAIFVEVVGADRRREMNEREAQYVRQGLLRPVVI